MKTQNSTKPPASESEYFSSKAVPPMEADMIRSTVSQEHADELAHILWKELYDPEPYRENDEGRHPASE